MKKEKLICPVKKDRLVVLLYNTITYINDELLWSGMSKDERLKLFKEELGFTDKELEELKISENCL